ncbi:TonB family protein [Pedobacter sp. WC2423]|uniref:TonB family protein n=1 Tax=Pedobacter sp. WC2423 TaxID=3234142 RepID=UPI003465E0A1
MTWAHYLLQVNIYLVIFYAFYSLLLAKETYFVLNRIYLITAGALSLIIPFLRPEWFVRQPAAHQIKISIDMMMSQGTIAPDENQPFSLIEALAIIYLIGILFFLCRLIFQLFTVRKLLSANPADMAFSFFGKKVIDPAIPGWDTIEKHEDIHIRQYHTFDVLFFELLGVLAWCNPVIYLYKTTVKHIHEYLADEEAARFQGDKESYALLILSQAMGVGQHVLTNSFFNKSMLKKRIIMLNKQRSTKTAILKYGLFLPLFAITLLFSSAAISKNENLKTVAEKIEAPVSTPEALITALTLSNTNSISMEQTSKWTPLYTYLAKSIKYPAEAYHNQLQGDVHIKFTLQNGALKSISTGAQLGEGCDTEVIRAISAFDGFKSTENGQFTITVAFRLAGANTPLKNKADITLKGYKPLKLITITGYNSKVPENDPAKVYDFVSITKQPDFPGGITMFYAYLRKNVKYPAEALKNNIQGKVFVSFIVEKDGKLNDIKVEQGLGGGTDEEAVRLLKESPKWTPGYQDRTPVRVKYNLPISFTTSSAQKDSPSPVQSGPPENALYIIDGKKAAGKSALETIAPDDIESINVFKGEKAITLYGKDGENGVIVITTKKKG